MSAISAAEVMHDILTSMVKTYKTTGVAPCVEFGKYVFLLTEATAPSVIQATATRIDNPVNEGVVLVQMYLNRYSVVERWAKTILNTILYHRAREMMFRYGRNVKLVLNDRLMLVRSPGGADIGTTPTEILGEDLKEEVPSIKLLDAYLNTIHPLMDAGALKIHSKNPDDCFEVPPVSEKPIRTSILHDTVAGISLEFRLVEGRSKILNENPAGSSLYRLKEETFHGEDGKHKNFVFWLSDKLADDTWRAVEARENVWRVICSNFKQYRF